MPHPVPAAVLAGGRSLRFPSDKGILPLPNGRPLLSHVVETAASVCPEVLLVVDRAGRYADLGLPAREVVDRSPGAGPLAALYTAFLDADSSYLLVIAGDMPFLNAGLLQHLVSVERTHDAVVAMFRGRPQVFPGLYSRNCTAEIENLLAARQSALQTLPFRVNTRYLPEPAWRPFDRRGLGFRCIDAPADLNEVRSLWPARHLA